MKSFLSFFFSFLSLYFEVALIILHRLIYIYIIIFIFIFPPPVVMPSNNSNKAILICLDSSLG